MVAMSGLLKRPNTCLHARDGPVCRQSPSRSRPSTLYLLCDAGNEASPAHKLPGDVRLVEARAVDEGSWGVLYRRVSGYCCTSHHHHAGNGKVLALLATPAPIERFALTCISDAGLAVLQLGLFSK